MCSFSREKGTEIILGLYPKVIFGVGVKMCSTSNKPKNGEFQDENTGIRLNGLYLDRVIRVYSFRKSAGKWTWLNNKIDLRMPAYYIDETLVPESRQEAKIRRRFE